VHAALLLLLFVAADVLVPLVKMVFGIRKRLYCGGASFIELETVG